MSTFVMSRVAGISGLAVCIAGLVGGGSAVLEARSLRPAAARDAAVSTDWRQVATPADRIRLRGWRQAWVNALAKVVDPDEMAALQADALLFDPDRVLAGATPPPGAYRCRVFKLGANGTAMHNVTMYPAVACKVDEQGGVSSLYKVSGAQRPVGLVYPDSGSRAVFLGTMVLGDETKPLKYGQDTNRDLAGYVERVGARRWRLVLPRPRFESVLDVVEIVPVPSL